MLNKCPFCGYCVTKAGFTSGRPRTQIYQCSNPALDDTLNWVCRRRTTKPVSDLPENLLRKSPTTRGMKEKEKRNDN